MVFKTAMEILTVPAVLSRTSLQKGAQYAREKDFCKCLVINSRMWCKHFMEKSLQRIVAKREKERERETEKKRERECQDKHCSHVTKSGAKEKSVERRARREVLL